MDAYARLEIRIKPKKTNSTKFSMIFTKTLLTGETRMLTRRDITANTLMSFLMASGMKAKDARAVLMSFGIPEDFFEWPSINHSILQ